MDEVDQLVRLCEKFCLAHASSNKSDKNKIEQIQNRAPYFRLICCLTESGSEKVENLKNFFVSQGDCFARVE